MGDYTDAVVQEDLYELLVTAKIEDALYMTGVMILRERFSDLEDIWIHACAGNELKGTLPSSWKWRDIITDTYNIVKSDAFDITDALLLTTKLCVFYKELLERDKSISLGGGKKPMVHIKHLRNVIMEDFPEGNMLSTAGTKRYKKLLPTDAEELLFAHRILSGLSRLWTEKQHEKSRDALEYLSRRRLSIQLPDTSWPSPTPEAAGEFIWFLWGAVMSFFQHVDTVYKLFFLFKKETKKNRKHQRLGLLWHAGHVLGSVDGAPWTIDENKWIAYVKENAASIWEQIRSAQEELKETERALRKASGQASPAEDFEDIFGFVPRTGTGDRYVTPLNREYQPEHMFTRLGGSERNERSERGREGEAWEEKRIKIIGLKSGRDYVPGAASVRKLE